MFGVCKAMDGGHACLSIRSRRHSTPSTTPTPSSSPITPHRQNNKHPSTNQHPHPHPNRHHQNNQEGLRPTVINYNALMEACGKVGDAAAALGFFEQMKVRMGVRCCGWSAWIV